MAGLKAKKRKPKNNLALFALGGVLLVLVVVLAVALSGKPSQQEQTLSADISQISQSKEPEQQDKDRPVFLSGSVEPKKVAPGDLVTVTAEIQDIYGIKQVKADMGAIAFIELNLISGTVKQGTWQGTWLAHDTKPQHYQTTLFADNIQDKQSQMTINWEDPTITDSFADETKIAATSNMIITGGQTRLWGCGDTVTFTYRGASVTYDTVTGANSECWLDRNLGASQVATAYNDANAYGDLFQWGRLDDQHQTRTSGTQTGLSSADNPGHSNFIYGMGSPFDWRSPQNDNLWQGVSGTNNPCPSGWRIPTNTELNAERASWSSQNYNGAYASPLKLTAGGRRTYSAASLLNVGSSGYYWSSTISATLAIGLNFNEMAADMSSYERANGYSVRCILD